MTNPFESRNPAIRALAAQVSLRMPPPDREAIEEQIAELEERDARIRRVDREERRRRSLPPVADVFPEVSTRG